MVCTIIKASGLGVRKSSTFNQALLGNGFGVIRSSRINCGHDYWVKYGETLGKWTSAVVRVHMG